MEVLVQPSGKLLSLKPGVTLLHALRENEIPISYSCEDGRCGMCRCKLLRGGVAEAARPPRQLFGCRVRYVLACQGAPTQDCAIEIPDTSETVVHPARRIRASVLGVEPLSRNVRLLRLSNEARLSFSPGQFAELELGRGISRVYSMSGLAGDEELRFHVRLHPHGRASHLIGETLKPGTALRLRGPYGASWLRQKHADPILCVSAGTGLAPLLSVLRGIALARLANPVQVYAGFMTSEEVYGLDQLSAALQAVPNLRGSHALVAAGKLERGLRRGLLTEVLETDLKQTELKRFQQGHAHVYGSPFAVDAAVQLLRRQGIAEDRLHADPFHAFGA